MLWIHYLKNAVYQVSLQYLLDYIIYTNREKVTGTHPNSANGMDGEITCDFHCFSILSETYISFPLIIRK